MLCAACAGNVQTATRSGDVAPMGQAYTVQLWSGNKKAEVPFPTQAVNASLRWMDADEGVIHWNEGFASNTQARDTVRVTRPHGALRQVRVSLDHDPAGTGPALVLDSVSVTSSSGAARFVCTAGMPPAKIQPGTSADLSCARR